MDRARNLLFVAAPGVCLGLPLLGAWWSGAELSPLFCFPPPLDIPQGYPRFSWWAAGSIFALGAWITGSWIRAFSRCPRFLVSGAPPSVPRGFPWWGWLSAGWTLAFWVMAWTRFPWFSLVQPYTFAPLWLGFVVTLNAIVWQRSGRCLMTYAPIGWGSLFLLSAVLWWGFEWINRFVRNWHYLSVDERGALAAVVDGSISFSTVLPAVVAMRELLGTCPRLQWRLAHGPAWRWVAYRTTAGLMVAAGMAGLCFAGAWPWYFYPTVWAAPLLIVGGLAVMTGLRGWWTDLVTGDWREAGSWALAALSCGFFWELWNLYSLEKWIYTVPFVQRWQVFEMPLLGYTGYLPFGLECALAVVWLVGRKLGARCGER